MSKVFIMKISFHSYANKTNFRMKSFALSLAFIMRFTATRNWPIRLGANVIHTYKHRLAFIYNENLWSKKKDTFQRDVIMSFVFLSSRIRFVECVVLR